MKIRTYLLAAGASLLFAGSLLASPFQQDQQRPPDNTKTNQGDANKGAMTAEQQKMNPADRETTKQIRSALMKDKSLSTYAHNIKVITRDGRSRSRAPSVPKMKRMRSQRRPHRLPARTTSPMN